MQVNPWKTLWWEYVTQITSVTTETCQLTVLNNFLLTLANLLHFPTESLSLQHNLSQSALKNSMLGLGPESCKVGHSVQTCIAAACFFLQEFTQSCLRHEAKLRPTAHDLLFHRVLFEVHSLKLLAAHCLISNQCEFLPIATTRLAAQKPLFLSHRIFYWRQISPHQFRQGVNESVNVIYRATKKGLLRQLPRLPSLLLSLQICFQKTVLRRKQSHLTPMLSWPRSDMKTGKVLGSSE